MNAIDPARFTHLHVHSHYSLLGGTASVAQLAGRAARDGLKTLALTDNHALYGAVAFDRACRAAGIQPIIGMTAVLPHPTTPRPRLVRPGTNHPAGYRTGRLPLLVPPVFAHSGQPGTASAPSAALGGAKS